MSLFGWSYPPGCSGPPDEDEAPCLVCGEFVDDCICPECDSCGCAGDPKCYDHHRHGGHDMKRSLAQDHSLALREDEYWQQAQADKAEGEYWAQHGELPIDADVPQ